MEIPGWAAAQKKRGTEVRCLNGRYYLYRISSVWDPEKGRARKVTEGYLGAITKDGLLKPKHERANEIMKNVSVKEFGATAFLFESCADIREALKREYPAEWRRIFAFSAFRFMHRSPLKNVHAHYTGSYLSETLGSVALSPKVLGGFLRSLGKDRERMKRFMKGFVRGTKFALIDSTHVFSLSEGIITAVTGHNSRKECLPQTRLLLVHSLDKHMPVYFRMLQGDITDVTAVPLTAKEAGIKDAVLIGDKGFYSDGNVTKLEDAGIRYVLPVARTSTLADYSAIASGDRTRLDGHFFFESRIIWYHEREADGRKVIVYLDPKLKAEEERDFMLRAQERKDGLGGFGDK